MKFPNPLKKTILAVAIEPGRLAVAAWSHSWNGWRLMRRESVNIDLDPLSDVIVSALRPLVLRWGLPPGTPVQIIAPPSIGGVIASDTPRTQKGATSVTEQDLVQILPFSPREIEWSARTQRFGERQITRCFWLPKSWVADLKVAFSRIGFRLDEIFARSEVLTYIEAEDKTKKEKKENEPIIGWVEAGIGRGYFHITKGHAAVSSRVLLGKTPDEMVREIEVEIATLEEVRGFRISALRSVNLPLPLRQALERLTCPISSVKIPQVPLAPPAPARPNNNNKNKVAAPAAVDTGFNVVDILDRVQKQGLEGFWVIPERDILFKPLYQLTSGIVVLGLLTCAALYGVSNAWDKKNTEMKAEIKKLNPRYEQVLLTEREIVRMQQAINGAEIVNDSLNPLDPLYRVYQSLPDAAWLERFSLQGNKIVFTGFGISPADLEKQLKESKYFSKVKVGERPDTPEDRGPAFSAEAEWVKVKGDDASILPPPPPLVSPEAAAAQPPATTAPGTPAVPAKPAGALPGLGVTPQAATPSTAAAPASTTPAATVTPPPAATKLPPPTPLPPMMPGGRPRVDPSTLRLPSLGGGAASPAAPGTATNPVPMPTNPAQPPVSTPAQTGGNGA